MSVVCSDVVSRVTSRSTGVVKTRSAFLPTGEELTADTSTKTLGRISEVVGSLDLWRRTHVFSSADASNFSAATDGERKHLIESILCLDRFDKADEVLKGTNDALVPKITMANADLADAKKRLFAVEERLRTWQEYPEYQPSQKPYVTDKPEPVDFDSLLKEIADEVAALGVAPQDTTQFQIKQLEGVLRDVQSKQAVCPTCKRLLNTSEGGESCVDVNHTRELIVELKKDQRAIQDEIQKHRGKLDRLADRKAEVQVRRNRYTAQLEEHERSLSRSREWESAEQKRFNLWQDKFLEHQSRKVSLEEEKVSYDLAVGVAEGRLAEFEQVRRNIAFARRVVGLQGARCALLDRALAGVEIIANNVLGRLGGGMSLKLSSYGTTKAGAVRDKISLEVEGLGHGESYQGSSAGERRRVDCALLLGLAEVSSAARGSQNGTLFFDEVFDALDDSGCDLVGQALSELAKDRCVVVITHRPELAESVPGARHVRIENGEIATPKARRVSNHD